MKHLAELTSFPFEDPCDRVVVLTCKVMYL